MSLVVFHSVFERSEPSSLHPCCKVFLAENSLDLPNNTLQIADFGTSRWSQHTNSTGLASYSEPNQNIVMSIAWSAPEVRTSRRISISPMACFTVMNRSACRTGVMNTLFFLLQVLFCVRGSRSMFPVCTPASCSIWGTSGWCQGSYPGPNCSVNRLPRSAQRLPGPFSCMLEALHRIV